MTADGERGLPAYLDAVAAGTPAPGGGSVVAVVGALAAALGEMVANLTLGRKKYASAEESLRPARDRLTTLRATLAAAAASDEAAYLAYRDASSLPQGSEDEKTARAAAIHQSLIAATDVPLGVARAAREVTEILEVVSRAGNPHLHSDTALGAILAEAALRGALLNVRGNAALLLAKDRDRAAAYLLEADQLEESGRETAQRAYQIATGAPVNGGVR